MVPGAAGDHGLDGRISRSERMSFGYHFMWSSCLLSQCCFSGIKEYTRYEENTAVGRTPLGLTMKAS